MKRVLLCVVTLLLSGALAGCVGPPVKYAPSATMTKEQAVARVERLLYEQWTEFTPEKVEVTDSYFRASNDKNKGMRGRDHVVLSDTRTVYYDNIGKVQLYDEGSLFQVMLRDKAGGELYKYYQKDGDKAKQFVDVMETLRQP